MDSTHHTREPAIKDRYAVLLWPYPPLTSERAPYHVLRIREYTPGGSVKGDLIACGFASSDIAQRAAERFASDAKRVADNEAAGLCACGLPYEAHVGHEAPKE